MADYDVLVGINDDKTGQRWEPGHTLAAGTFPAEVEANWLEIGVLRLPDPEPAPVAPATAKRESRKKVVTDGG